jgi:PAS domain S-box-containing protein
MKTNDQPPHELEDLRNRLKETEEMLRYFQYREEMLRKSDQEKTAILNSLSEEITYLDMDMRVLWTNKTAADSAGLSPEQIVGRYCYDVWCRNGEPLIDCPAVRTIKTGQREEGEISIPDGRIFLHRSYPTLDAKGNMAGIVQITLNITERKQAEKVLWEGENAYRTLAENLPGTVYRVFLRENNRMEFFNKMLQPMTGYTAEELTAGEVCSIEPLILSEDRPTAVATVKRAILDNQSFEVEYRLRNKGGETRYFLERGRPIYGEDGKALYIDGIILDITARKVAEEALLFKQNIVKHSSSVIATCDLEGNMTYGNPSFLKTWGFDNPEQFLGRPFWEFWLVEDRRAEIMRVLRDDGAWFGEIKAIRKDGSIFDVQVSAAMVFDSGGNPVALTSTSIDITERKYMEELILRSREELEKQVEERTKELREEIAQRKQTEEALGESEKRLRFLSSQLIAVQEQERKRIASELHEGLGALLSGIKYKVEAALQQRAKNQFKAMEKQLESVIPIIQESVEEVRRIQTDLRPATLDSLGLLATIRSFCRKFQTTYPSISIRQQVDIEEGEIPASLKIVIYRISQEALNNVAKHSKADLAHLFVRKREGKMELVIQDNGQGFDVNEALSRESPGQGLGLPSMRERAELSGGLFTIDSAIGKGTTIRSSWPCV